MRRFHMADSLMLVYLREALQKYKDCGSDRHSQKLINTNVTQAALVQTSLKVAKFGCQTSTKIFQGEAVNY